MVRAVQAVRKALPTTGFHVGIKPIPLPSNTTLSILPSTSDLASSHSVLRVSGPRGNMQLQILPFVSLKICPGSGSAFDPASQIIVEKEGNSGVDESTLPSQRHVQVSVTDAWNKSQKAMWGTTRSLIASAIQGVNNPFVCNLTLVGVGYRATMEEGTKILNMRLGYADPVRVPVWDDLEVQVTQPTKIVVTGVNKQRVTLFAAIIRRHREPEPYNGKGIFVNNETIRRKEAKKK